MGSAEWRQQKTAPYSLRISEIDTLKQEITGVSAQVGRKGALSIYLEAEPGRDPDAPHSYELFLVDRKTYTFGVASN